MVFYYQVSVHCYFSPLIFPFFIICPDLSYSIVIIISALMRVFYFSFFPDINLWMFFELAYLLHQLKLKALDSSA